MHSAIFRVQLPRILIVRVGVCVCVCVCDRGISPINTGRILMKPRMEISVLPTQCVCVCQGQGQGHPNT